MLSGWALLAAISILTLRAGFGMTHGVAKNIGIRFLKKWLN
tara:strand:- start:193 stop:315 length:123 start_codon:yes stop_codon:yes gene_type:complete